MIIIENLLIVLWKFPRVVMFYNIWVQLLTFINIFVISSFVLNMSFWHLTSGSKYYIHIIVFNFRKKWWWRWLRRLAQWLFVVNLWRHLPTPTAHGTRFDGKSSIWILSVYLWNHILALENNKIVLNLLLPPSFWRKIVHLSFSMIFYRGLMTPFSHTNSPRCLFWRKIVHLNYFYLPN